MKNTIITGFERAVCFLIRFRAFVVGALYIFAGWGFVALADVSKLPDVGLNNYSDVKQKIICGTAGTMFYVLLAVSVILVLYAAYRYLTSAGDPEKVKDATRTITYAAVAVVVALIAKGFPYIIADIFGTNGQLGVNQPC